MGQIWAKSMQENLSSYASSSAIQEFLNDADEVRAWLDGRLNQMGRVEATPRNRMAGALLNLALEHHYAILRLVEAELVGSAFALLRVQFETTLRGIWIAQCATDEQLRKFQDGKRATIGEMAAAVDRLGPSPGPFGRIKQGALASLHGFTHGGLEQVERFTKDNQIESNFPEDEVLAALAWSLILASGTAVILCEIAGNTEIPGQLLARVTELTDGGRSDGVKNP